MSRTAFKHKQSTKEKMSETQKIRYQICPDCGADRKVLRDCLKERPGTDNWENARKIIENCEVCKSILYGQYRLATGICETCGAKMEDHPKCEACGNLTGRNHLSELYEYKGRQLCAECRRWC